MYSFSNEMPLPLPLHKTFFLDFYAISFDSCFFLAKKTWHYTEYLHGY